MKWYFVLAIIVAVIIVTVIVTKQISKNKSKDDDCGCGGAKKPGDTAGNYSTATEVTTETAVK